MNHSLSSNFPEKEVFCNRGQVNLLCTNVKPSFAYLLPSIHIALIRLKDIVANLSELYALLRQENVEDSFTLISGPSKTADIEAHMVHGAHEPKEMHLVVIDEQMVSQTIFKGFGLFSSGAETTKLT